MSHLTYQQIQNLADDAAGNERETLLRHLRECSRCSREVALQRSLARAAKEAPVIKTSNRFTRKVMGTIGAAGGETWLFRFFLGAARIVAMAAVLGAIVYAMTLLPGLTGVSSEQSEVSKLFSGYYQQATQFIAQESGRMSQAMTSQSSTQGSKILSMMLFSLVVLGLLDRLVLKPFLRARR